MLNLFHSGSIKTGGVFLFLLLMLLVPTSVIRAEVASSELLQKGNDALALGNIEKAEALLLQIHPPRENENDQGAFVRSRMTLARLYFGNQAYDRAEEMCRQVLTVSPKNSQAKNFLASIKRKSRPAYQQFFLDIKRFFPSLAKGSVMTLVLVVFTMLVSPVGGLLVALGRISTIRMLSILCWFFIWIFRGTPLLLQLFFIYYGLPAIGITLEPFTAALTGLGLNYSAYLAEIIRGGIQSIDSGQMEAAKALGMSYSQAMRRIIIPQTYKRLMPPVGNEFIALVKDTALVSTIAMVELMRSADQLFNTYFNITVLILAAVIYLIFTSILTVTFEKIERMVGAYEKR